MTIQRPTLLNEQWKPGDPIRAADYAALHTVINRLSTRLAQLERKLNAPELRIVELNADLKPGYKLTFANECVVNASAGDGDDQFIIQQPTISHIFEPQLGLYLKNERHLIFNVGSRSIPIPTPCFHIGKLSAELTYEASAACAVWRWNHATDVWEATASPAISVTVYDWLLSSGQTIASGKKVAFILHQQSRKFVVIAAECP